jgi:hypothetical protein
MKITFFYASKKGRLKMSNLILPLLNPFALKSRAIQVQCKGLFKTANYLSPEGQKKGFIWERKLRQHSLDSLHIL